MFMRLTFGDNDESDMLINFVARNGWLFTECSPQRSNEEFDNYLQRREHFLKLRNNYKYRKDTESHEEYKEICVKNVFRLFEEYENELWMPPVMVKELKVKVVDTIEDKFENGECVYYINGVVYNQ